MHEKDMAGFASSIPCRWRSCDDALPHNHPVERALLNALATRRLWLRAMVFASLRDRESEPLAVDLRGALLPEGLSSRPSNLRPQPRSRSLRRRLKLWALLKIERQVLAARPQGRIASWVLTRVDRAYARIQSEDSEDHP
jgi:hypothetical protein